MKVNKPLFVSSITFLAILISVLIASFNIDGYTMTWPYFATFAISLVAGSNPVGGTAWNFF